MGKQSFIAGLIINNYQTFNCLPIAFIQKMGVKLRFFWKFTAISFQQFMKLCGNAADINGFILNCNQNTLNVFLSKKYYLPFTDLLFTIISFTIYLMHG
jgi:hypothetical protein